MDGLYPPTVSQTSCPYVRSWFEVLLVGFVRYFYAQTDFLRILSNLFWTSNHKALLRVLFEFVSQSIVYIVLKAYEWSSPLLLERYFPKVY